MTHPGAPQPWLAPMREPTYYILAALQDEARHGYAIIKRAGELSNGRVRPATGTLYTALDRLTGEGFVRVVNEEAVNGRVRRYYALTPDGLAALRAEAIRLAEAASVVIDRAARIAPRTADGLA
jgi:PadR family transcriptional regulator PadR